MNSLKNNSFVVSDEELEASKEIFATWGNIIVTCEVPVPSDDPAINRLSPVFTYGSGSLSITNGVGATVSNPPRPLDLNEDESDSDLDMILYLPVNEASPNSAVEGDGVLSQSSDVREPLPDFIPLAPYEEPHDPDQGYSYIGKFGRYFVSDNKRDVSPFPPSPPRNEPVEEVARPVLPLSLVPSRKLSRRERKELREKRRVRAHHSANVIARRVIAESKEFLSSLTLSLFVDWDTEPCRSLDYNTAESWAEGSLFRLWLEGCAEILSWIPTLSPNVKKYFLPYSTSHPIVVEGNLFPLSGTWELLFTSLGCFKEEITQEEFEKLVTLVVMTFAPFLKLPFDWTRFMFNARDGTLDTFHGYVVCYSPPSVLAALMLSLFNLYGPSPTYFMFGVLRQDWKHKFLDEHNSWK
jgi:hypothetical protein